MALIFPRLAHNFLKMGYYPTDELTLTRLLNAIDIGAANLRILDPCCGEGAALAEIKNHLVSCGSSVTALGVEYDTERAWHSKTILDKVIHSDINDVFITARSQSLLFLNPPYGDVVSDKALTGDISHRDRLEKQFYRKTIPWLQFEGILVLIVPYYVLDKEFSSMIARNFTHVKAFMSPEQQFKQCVVFGVKRRSDGIDPDTQSILELCGKGEAPVLPEFWTDNQYVVPEAKEKDIRFTAIRIDGKQLQSELNRLNKNTLWPQFKTLFSLNTDKPRQPLRALSNWHLALALAAGQISGVVESSSGRRLLIKGDTFKQRDLTVTHETTENGDVSETRTFTDKFVPAITGIDFTPGDNYGQLVSIR